MKKKLVLGVITARGGSKRIPCKNIKLLDSKPLIVYTFDVAKKCNQISHLILSTDDLEIITLAKKYGIECPFVRPLELANDKAGHLEVVKHALSFMEDKLGIVFDAVVILQPTSPFRIPEDIDFTIEKLINSDADSAVTMVLVEDNHPKKMKRFEGNLVLPYCIPEKQGERSQDLPLVYKRSGAAYVIKRDVIMEKGQLYGEKTIGHIVPQERSVDIDTEFDWLKAEYMLKKLKQAGYDF